MGFCRKGWLRCDDSKHAKPRNFSERKKHAQSAAPTGAYFLLIRKFPKGKRFYVLFASAKRTKKQPGLRPATSVQIAGRYGIVDRMTGFYQVTGYERTTILHRIDGNDLNRCELQALHKRICGFVRTRSRFFGKQ